MHGIAKIHQAERREFVRTTNEHVARIQVVVYDLAAKVRQHGQYFPLKPIQGGSRDVAKDRIDKRRKPRTQRREALQIPE